MRNRKVSYSANAVFGALSDSTRRAVLDLLRSGALPAGVIAQHFPVSRPAISKHLRLLRQARLVEEHRDGRRRVYRLRPGPLRSVDLWLNRYREFWRMTLTSLKGFVETEQRGFLQSGRMKRKNRKS